MFCDDPTRCHFPGERTGMTAYSRGSDYAKNLMEFHVNGKKYFAADVSVGASAIGEETANAPLHF